MATVKKYIKDYTGSSIYVGHQPVIDHGNFSSVGSRTIRTEDPNGPHELDLGGFDVLIYNERDRLATEKLIALVDQVSGHNEFTQRRAEAMEDVEYEDIHVDDYYGHFWWAVMINEDNQFHEILSNDEISEADLYDAQYIKVYIKSSLADELDVLKQLVIKYGTESLSPRLNKR